MKYDSLFQKQQQLLREMELSLSHLTKGQEQIMATCQSLDRKKVSKEDFDEFLTQNSNKIMDLDEIITQHGNDIKSVENTNSHFEFFSRFGCNVPNWNFILWN